MIPLTRAACGTERQLEHENDTQTRRSSKNLGKAEQLREPSTDKRRDECLILRNAIGGGADGEGVG